MQANTHLRGSNCRKCSSKKPLISVDKFIEKLKQVHGDTYDYSLIKSYHGSMSDINIICKIHGVFSQKPKHHLRGSGCPKCGKIKRDINAANSNRNTTESFIERSKIKHKNKYDYSKSIYTNAKDNIIITCPKHGDFSQNVAHHLNGHGCPQCRIENVSWLSHNRWTKAGKESLKFDSFKVYIVKITTADNVFFKIGKSYRKLTKRFELSKVDGYEWELVHLFESKTDGKYISELELKLQSFNKQYKFLPDIKFGGRHECFSKFILPTDLKY